METPKRRTYLCLTDSVQKQFLQEVNMLLTFSVRHVARLHPHELVWKVRITDSFHVLPDRCDTPFDSRVTPVINKMEGESHSLREEALSIVPFECRNGVCEAPSGMLPMETRSKLNLEKTPIFNLTLQGPCIIL